MTDNKAKHLARRHASEKRFKFMGLTAVLVACSFLVVLLSTVVGKGLPAFTHHYVNIPIDFTGYVEINSPEKGDYNPVYKNGIAELFPFMKSRKEKRIARKIVSNGAGVELQYQVVTDPELIAIMRSAWLPFDDYADLYLKGLVAENSVVTINSGLQFERSGDAVTITVLNSSEQSFKQLLQTVKSSLGGKISRISNTMSAKILERDEREKSDGDAKILERLDAEIITLESELAALEKQQGDINSAETLNRTTPSILMSFNGAIVKINHLTVNQAKGILLTPLAAIEDDKINNLHIRTIVSPEQTRKLSDMQIALIEHLRSNDKIEKRWNKIFFTRGASREPEQAGIWGALVGSLLTMGVTLLLAFPLGVSTAIYLEEFAPRNKLTDIIEVNINNLAAVPSIIFGLLGLSVFLNWFEFPRSAPLVGGLVLALMTLPTIIIASRAAIKAVPPSIREAALGIGASRVQAVFHHVLPLAMPGMLTGTIIGMAQALGETAPLLMIGMVAFIVDIPAALTDPATVMPVQIYMWADFPEPAFQQKTAAAILVLLAFLVTMNALAVILRRRFERRW